MNPEEQFQQLSRCLAGIFQNREQALAEPAWYVHIRLWSCPIPLFREDSATFFIEQASAAYPQPPYRQRVLRLRSQATGLTAEYYALQEPTAFQGAAQEQERLQGLMITQLQPLVKSQLKITAQLQPDTCRFEARQLPGERCEFTVNGETKFVELAFDAIAPTAGSQAEAAFWMYDKGIDPNTGKATWGALNGPFKLKKVEDWSALLPSLG
ncbi:MAG TPA: chromophore lyase CpcT/CpeT [Candidatus Obscuribacterales bacterium]